MYIQLLTSGRLVKAEVKSQKKTSALGWVKLIVCGIALSLTAEIHAATTGFNQTGAGPYDYNTAGNWVSGTINGTWDTSLTLVGPSQTVTFAANTTLSTALGFSYSGNYPLTLDSSSATAETITLGGDITLNTGGGTSANVTIGDPTDILNVSLANANRNFNVAANRTLTLVNVISSTGTSGGITLGNTSAAGSVILSGANTFTGPTVVKAGNTLTVSGTGTIGGGSSAPTLTVGGVVSGSSSSTATFNYFSSGASTVGQLLIGAGGSGSPPGLVNITNGTLTANPLIMCNSKDSTGVLNLSGATLNVSGSGAYMTVGVRGSTVASSLATVNMTNGFLNVAGPLIIGGYSSGGASQGIFNQYGGTNTVSSTVTMAAAAADAYNHVGTYNLFGGTLIASSVNGQANTSTGANYSTNNFAGGTLKPNTSTTTFLQGVTACNVQNGGAIIDTAGFSVTISNALLHYAGATTDSLTKLGAGTLTLAGTNTYAYTTAINGGTLALAANGSISNSSAISIAAGSTFDVSAISSFNLSSSTTLSASGNATAANIKGASGGTVNLGSQAITLNYDGSHPALTISQGSLVLAGNAFTVNGTALAAGSYPIIQQTSGTITTNNPNFTVNGTALGSGTGTLDFSTTGQVKLQVTVTPVAGSVSATNSTVIASPASLQADNATASTITVTLKDTNNVALGAGTNVAWTVSGADNSVTPASSGTTSGGGFVTFTVKSLKAETKNVTVTVGATTITNSLTISFTNPAVGNVIKWDPSLTGTGSDGGGVWNASTVAWANAGTDFIWPNNGNDNVVIGSGTGTAGTITNGIAVSVGNITFNAPSSGSYVLGTNSTPAITINAGNITNNAFPQLNCQLNGSFNLYGSGRLALAANGTQTSANTVTVNSPATLRLGANGGAGSVGSANVTVNSGATLDYRYSGTIIISNSTTGAGNVTYELRTGPTTFGSSANQSYTGTTLLEPTGNSVNNGALVLDTANRLPTTTDFTISSGGYTGSTVALDLNGNNQSLASLATDAGATASSCIITNSSATVATLTLNGASRTKYFNGNIAGNISFTLTGAGSSLNLSNANTYTGNTTISAGTLALSGNGSIANSLILGVASGAIFNVSSLTTAFTLGGSQTLTNFGSGAIINGTNNTGSGTVSLFYDGANPSFIVTNGGMTLSASTIIKVNNTGAALGAGTFLIISNVTAGSAGLVAGTTPSVNLSGNTFANTTAALLINGSGLNLVIKTNQTIVFGAGTSLTQTYGDAPFSDTATASSGLAVTYSSDNTGVATVDAIGNVTIVGAGSCHILANQSGNGTYNAAPQVSQTLLVNPAASTWSYTGSSFIYNATTQAPVINFTGSTGVRTTNYVGIGSTSYSSSSAPVNAGNYAVTNTVLPDVNYVGATNSTTFTINQTNLTITARSNTKIYDGSTSATNAPTITAGSLQGGDTATLTEAYTDANVGTGKTLVPSIAITNSGVDVSANYDVTKINDTTGVINPAQAATVLLLTNNVGVTNHYGQPLIFTAVLQTNTVTAADAGSNVVFSLGGTPVWTNAVVGGVASYTNDDLTAGVTNFTAQYLGDNNYLASSITVTQTVLQTTPILTLTASAITFGQTLSSSTLTGSVATNNYDDDADQDAAVAGSFAFADNTISPNAGLTNVWVIFTPTDTTNYTTASNTVAVTVNMANSTVLVTGLTSFTYNGAGQGPATANVTGSGGLVSYSYSATGYGPSANTPTNAGSYTVTATVAADNNYKSATSSPTTFNINPAPASVTADSKTKTYGATNPTLTAIVVGQVIGGDTISYSLSTDAGQYSAAGVSNILVNLGSNPNYSVSATNGTLTIYQASSFVGASSTENPSGYKDAISFTATLPADATGDVVFSSPNGPISTNTVSGGIATSLSITDLPRGTNVITVAYLGDGNYLGSTTNLDQIVTNHPPVANVMAVTRTAGLALIIKLSDIATNWSDVDGDTIELTSVTMQSTNGVNLFPLNWSTNLDGSIVATNGYAYIGYTNSPNVADQISYGISDGFGGTNIGYVNIVIQGSVTGTNSITAYNFTSPSSNTVTAYGIPFFYYILERSTNLSSSVWVDVQTNQAAPNGVINAVDTFWDLSGNKPSPAFYQLKWQP